MASAPLVGPVFAPESSVPAAVRGGFRTRRLSNAEMLWLAFVTVQALDGGLSYIGVSRHGPGIEANPLVAWYLSAFGPAVGFTAAKLFAITCGAILYVTARHRWMAVLTLMYLAFAVGPWLSLLAGGV